MCRSFQNGAPRLASQKSWLVAAISAKISSANIPRNSYGTRQSALGGASTASRGLITPNPP